VASLRDADRLMPNNVQFGCSNVQHSQRQWPEDESTGRKHSAEGHLNDMAASDATIALGWEEIGQLGRPCMAKQDFHGGIEVSLNEAQDREICYANGTSLFLQKDLKAGLPVGKGISWLKAISMIRAWNSAMWGQSMLAL